MRMQNKLYHGQQDRNVSGKMRQDLTLLLVIQHAPSPPFGFGILEAGPNKLVLLVVYTSAFMRNIGEIFSYERRIASYLSAMRGRPYPYADPVELALLFSLQFAWQDLITYHLPNLLCVDNILVRRILSVKVRLKQQGSEDNASHSITYNKEKLAELHTCMQLYVP
ncbi:hypothetical protein VNO77_31243 [Canavalia gladiata]|uniref:Uncharacterized protein n=1 Tax=Canavalia gladiata TaxID=3824 RepID=A0AAN9KNT9_CANGL